MIITHHRMPSRHTWSQFTNKLYWKQLLRISYWARYNGKIGINAIVFIGCQYPDDQHKRVAMLENNEDDETMKKRLLLLLPMGVHILKLA